MRDATEYRHRTGIPARFEAEACPANYWKLGVPFDPGARTSPEPPLAAFINQGRWVVVCPDGDGGAQLASQSDPRFMCVECGNLLAGGMWRQVAFPDVREQIVAVLQARPDAALQNWVPGESVEDLIAENDSIGIPGEVIPPVSPGIGREARA